MDNYFVKYIKLIFIHGTVIAIKNKEFRPFLRPFLEQNTWIRIRFGSDSSASG